MELRLILKSKIILKSIKCKILLNFVQIIKTMTMKHQEIQHTATMSPVYRFFCWCSGARLYILKECPSDFNKYLGIGIIVFLTGVMASLSGGYAMYTVFQSMPAAVAFGFLWGTLIFFLDWYLISSLKKEEKTMREFAYAFPRLILSVFLAIIISVPLKLKLFEREIAQQMSTMQRNHAVEYKNLVDNEFNEINQLGKTNSQLINEIKQKEAERNRLFEMIIKEAEGKSATGAVGKGPVYREKKRQFDKIEQELAQLKQRNHTLIDENNTRLVELKNMKTKEMQTGLETNRAYNGLLARLQALGELSNSNTVVRYASIFIILLFICIESSPILVKLMAKRGPYDQMLEKEEYAIFVDSKKTIYDMKSAGNNYLEALSQKNKLKAEQIQEVNRQFVAQIMAAQAEINRKKVEKWKEKELEELANQTNHLRIIN